MKREDGEGWCTACGSFACQFPRGVGVSSRFSHFLSSVKSNSSSVKDRNADPKQDPRTSRELHHQNIERPRQGMYDLRATTEMHNEIIERPRQRIYDSRAATEVHNQNVERPGQGMYDSRATTEVQNENVGRLLQTVQAQYDEGEKYLEVLKTRYEERAKEMEKQIAYIAELKEGIVRSNKTMYGPGTELAALEEWLRKDREASKRRTEEAAVMMEEDKRQQR